LKLIRSEKIVPHGCEHNSPKESYNGQGTNKFNRKTVLLQLELENLVS